MVEKGGGELRYLPMVQAGNTTLAVVTEACESGLEVLSFDGHRVRLKAGCLPVDVSWETCLCHGGRIWAYQEHTNIGVELSSEEYDEEKGIVDPDTELAWRIEHELADVVRGFCQYVHVVVERGKYGNKDRVERHYFDSVEKAARYVFEEDGHDLLSEYGEVVHQYPNKDIRLRVTYVGDEGGKIKLKGEKLQRRDGEFAVDYEYSIEYLVFRKGMRI